MCLTLYNTVTSLPEPFDVEGVGFIPCYKEVALYQNALFAGFRMSYQYSFTIEGFGLRVIDQEVDQDVRIRLYDNDIVVTRLKLGYHARGFPYPELCRPMLSKPKTMSDGLTIPVFIHPCDLQIINKDKHIVAKSFWLLDPKYLDPEVNPQTMHCHPLETPEERAAYEEVYNRVKKGLTS